MVQKNFDKKVKTKMSLISPVILKSIGEILTKGQKDHKNSEWLFMDPKDYLDSCLRHMNEVQRDVFSENVEDGDKFHIEHLATDCIILADIVKYLNQLDSRKIYEQEPEFIKKLQKLNLCEKLGIKKLPDIIETEDDYINFKKDLYDASIGYVCSTESYYRNRAKARIIRILKNVITDEKIEITSMFIRDVAVWTVLNRFNLLK